jgi:hypothetical protein
VICETCGNQNKSSVTGYCSTCSRAQEQRNKDELLPFREASRLGCKDFQVRDNQVVHAVGTDFIRIPSSFNGVNRNRQAAACCYWFWENQINNKSVLMLHIVEMKKFLKDWALKHCAENVDGA